MDTARRLAGRALLILALGASVYSYELLDHPVARPHVLRTSLDAALPFVPLLAIPYLLYVPLGLFTFFLLGFTNWTRFRTLAIAVIIACLAADLFYIFFQTYVARPDVSGNDLGARLVRFVYATDQPYNDFPSLHVANSTLCAIAYFRWKTRYGLLALPLVTAIIASTVLIRQHYLADVAAGLVFAGLSYGIATRVTPDVPKSAARVPHAERAAVS